MIEKTVKSIKDGLSESDKKTRTDKPIDIVIAGGTSSPPGFETLFAEILQQAKLPLAMDKIVRPNDPLYSVDRGCLIAAENATK